MTQIALASTGHDVDEKFTETLGTAFLPLPMPTSAQLTDFYGWFAEEQPDVLVLDARVDQELSLEIASHLTATHPHVVVLCYTDQMAEMSLPAMRAGVSDLVPADIDVTALEHTLNEAIQRSKTLTPAAPLTPTERLRGRVLSTISASGGVGKTILATNLAVKLAKAGPYSTVLVDLDLQFGDVETVLGLQPEYRLEDVLDSAARGDTIALKSRLTLHESGLLVLPAPADPATADTISNQQIDQLLDALTHEFPFVIIDTETGLSDHTLSALDYTSHPLLVTSLSVPSIHGLRKVVETLSLLQMYQELSMVVVNFADSKNGVTTEDVMKTLDLTEVMTIPTSKRALASINTGIPLATSRPRDPLVKALRPLVKELLPRNKRDKGSAARSASGKDDQ